MQVSAARQIRLALGRIGHGSAAVLLCLSLGGCAAALLSEAVTTVNEEVAASQNQQLLLNIVRRSEGQPMRFTSLNIVRDRNRVTAGANLTIPFGREAPTRFEFNPNFSVEQRPQFEVSPQDNQEFYRALLAPISIGAIKDLLQQAYRYDLVLFMTIDKIRIRTAGADRTYLNDPAQPDAFVAFKGLLESLIDEGLGAQEIRLARDIGPPLPGDKRPDIGQLISLHKEGLAVDQVQRGGGKRSFQVRQISGGARFCFAAPRTALFREARCGRAAGGAPPRFVADDSKLFSYADGNLARFDGGSGSIEIHTRSISEIIDHVADLARVSLAGSEPVAVRTRGKREKLFVLETGVSAGRSLVAVTYAGQRYAVPAGPDGGMSGEVISVLSKLLAQAQSIESLPNSGSVTLIAD